MFKNDQQYVLELMLKDMSNRTISDFIHNRESLLRSFQSGGFKLSKTDELHIKRRIKIIIENVFESDFVNLFMQWYEDKDNYENILKPYFTSKAYETKLEKENINNGSYHIFSKKIFNLLLDEMRISKHILFFQYFSPIKFTKEQNRFLKRKYYKLSQETEKIEHAPALTEDKATSNEYKKKNEHLQKEISKLHNQISQLKTNYKEKKEHVKKLKHQLTNLHKLEESFETENKDLKETKLKNEELIKANEKLRKENDNLVHKLNVERKQAYENYLESKQKELQSDIVKFEKELREKANKLEIKITNLTHTKEELEKFHEQKRGELEEYIQNGESWKNAFRPRKTMSCEIIDNEFETIFKTINIKKKMEITRSRFVLFNSEFISTFKDNVFTLYADSSDISVEKFYSKKGFFRAHNKTYNFLEFLKIAEYFSNCCFACVIFNSNRAPIECYFSNVINAIENKIHLVIENESIKIPENIIFFFQLDEDEYSAKPSKFINELVKKIPDGDKYESY